MKDRSPTVRDKAVLLVTEKGFDHVVHLVEPLLYDKSGDVRYDAAECVGILGKRSAGPRPGLRALLSDKRALIRAQAAESLALVGDKGALPKIVRLLADRVPYVRSYAASAIGDLGGIAYVERIRRILMDERSERARVGLLEALFALGDRAVLKDFLRFLESPDYHVRCAAANALEVIPLKRPETQLALTALKKAKRKSLCVADRSTMGRVLEAVSKPM